MLPLKTQACNCAPCIACSGWWLPTLVTEACTLHEATIVTVCAQQTCMQHKPYRLLSQGALVE